MPHREKTTEYVPEEGRSHPIEVIFPDQDETKCPLCDAIVKVDSLEECFWCEKKVCNKCWTKQYGEALCYNCESHGTEYLIKRLIEIIYDEQHKRCCAENDLADLKRELRK